MLKSDLLKKLSHELDELCVYSSDINYNEEYYGFGTMDVAAYGTSSTMDIFSSLYKHTFMSDDFNMIPMGHSIIPFYMKYNQLLPHYHSQSEKQFLFL